MQKESYITFHSKRKKMILARDAILYAMIKDNRVKIHTAGGEVHETRMALHELEELLGDTFIKVKRNSLVSASAIESIADLVHLKNGETLAYTVRQKRRIMEELLQKSALAEVSNREEVLALQG